jgi:hypothetical protein
MIQLSSVLENSEDGFGEVNGYLGQFGFTLGGNWDYEHGYFDRNLDEAHKVWLRIPFKVIQGALDGDNVATDAVVKMGKPFILKHMYNEGLDKEATPKVYGSLFDQFQEPVDKDADVENKWVHEAANLLKKVEQGWAH